jgi:uncharacterized phage protein (TIGR02218 family)
VIDRALPLVIVTQNHFLFLFMKTASTALINLLATRQFYSADLYNFSLVGGGQLNYSGGDRDIVWNSVTWSSGVPNGPFFDRKDNKAKCHWKVGVEVDTLVFDVLPGSATLSGTPFLTAVREGLFDGAELTLYRAFMPTYGNTAAGTVIMFVGRVAEIDAGRSLATFSVNSHLELLNLNMPRNLYQAGCVNALFDTSCTLSASSFAVSGTAAAGSTVNAVKAALAQASGYFALGQITFTSGANAGVSRTVQAYTQGTPGSINLITPLAAAPSAGDTFIIYPGCDKQQSTCSAKFNNLANFRGFPYVPENSTAV